jgi:hypothetical protein
MQVAFNEYQIIFENYKTVYGQLENKNIENHILKQE